MEYSATQILIFCLFTAVIVTPWIFIRKIAKGLATGLHHIFVWFNVPHKFYDGRTWHRYEKKEE